MIGLAPSHSSDRLGRQLFASGALAADEVVPAVAIPTRPGALVHVGRPKSRIADMALEVFRYAPEQGNPQLSQRNICIYIYNIYIYVYVYVFPSSN